MAQRLFPAAETLLKSSPRYGSSVHRLESALRKRTRPELLTPKRTPEDGTFILGFELLLEHYHGL